MLEKNKTRLMVVPIVAVLVVTMFVAGNWQQSEEQGIEVEEGYDEIVITEDEIPAENEVENYSQKKSIVTTYVNNESFLEFVVEPRSGKRDNEAMDVRIKLSAEGFFEDELDISTFRFRASEKEESEKPFNNVHFKTSYSQIEGGERWSPHEQQIGKAMVGPEYFAFEGYDLDSNEFSVETMLYWEIDSENIGEEFTLQLEAIVGGLSEDVLVTVDICFESDDV